MSALNSDRRARYTATDVVAEHATGSRNFYESDNLGYRTRANKLRYVFRERLRTADVFVIPFPAFRRGTKRAEPAQSSLLILRKPNAYVPRTCAQSRIIINRFAILSNTLDRR